MYEYAISQDLDGAAVYLEEHSLNTIGNLFFSKKTICEPNEFYALRLITGSAHVSKVTFLAQRIFGPQFQIAVDGVEEPEVIGTRSTTRQLIDIFKDIPQGNDEKMWNIISAHKYYTKGFACKSCLGGTGGIQRQ